MRVVNGTADCELDWGSSWEPSVVQCSDRVVEGVHRGEVISCLETRVAGSKFERWGGLRECGSVFKVTI